jgi:diguanylate cyclase (GGDEF)-like protein/PAS domain S-box-containing protein
VFRWKLTTTARITIGLTGLLVSALCLVSLLGLFPDRRSEINRLRAGICETGAIGFSMLADNQSKETVRRYLEAVAERNPDIVSIGIRDLEGSLIIDVGGHGNQWIPVRKGVSDDTQVSVELSSQGQPWGTVEVCLANKGEGRMFSLLSPAVAHGAVLAVFCGTVFFFYLRFVLRQLDPSKVVPQRVREALDTLGEGLLILDHQQHIVLANRAFGDTTGMTQEELTGISVSRLPFLQSDGDTTTTPWIDAIRTGQAVLGQLIGMTTPDKKDLTFSVSASPIVDEQGNRRGTLTTFEDVTSLERKKRELAVMVDHLRISSDALKQQNQELERLARHDTLTGLLIRRPFFERLDAEWKSAVRCGHDLSAIMLDVDHFKSVNDSWGHVAGDDVLRKVARCLRDAARENEIVCRYGGEEFAVLLPHADLDAASVAAERFRAEIEELQFPSFTVTASVGVSSLSGEPKDAQDLLSQADQCLYAAKRSGRNRVVRWDEFSSDIDTDESLDFRGQPRVDEHHTSIPFHAVTALVSALAYRDRVTAEHSRRVADLCVATAEGVMSFSSCYVLEIAALLHDIGKIGVPDSVLLKPGPLTPEEWTLMRRNEIIGAEITRASFGSPELSRIVENYQAHYGGGPAARPGLPSGNNIPLGARILAIANAYDAMVTDHAYREGCSPNEAFAELRRCAGTQFDPELVERFIGTVRDRGFKMEQLPQGVSREIALAIGLQVERLLVALDSEDQRALEAICSHVHSTAEKYGAVEIAAKAAEACTILKNDTHTDGLIAAAYDLLDLCRSTQAAFLEAVTCVDPSLPNESTFCDAQDASEAILA